MATTMEVGIAVCPRCGQKNRVAPHGAGRLPVCGRCGAELPAAAAGAGPVKVTDANYEAEVLRSPLPVLLDCWAPWCGPCRMIAPVIDQLAGEVAGRVKVAKLNVDENPRTASLLGIQGIPALKLVHGGRVVDELVGAAPKQQILQLLRPYLS